MSENTSGKPADIAQLVKSVAFVKLRDGSSIDSTVLDYDHQLMHVLEEVDNKFYMGLLKLKEVSESGKDIGPIVCIEHYMVLSLVGVLRKKLKGNYTIPDSRQYELAFREKAVRNTGLSEWTGDIVIYRRDADSMKIINQIKKNLGMEVKDTEYPLLVRNSGVKEISYTIHNLKEHGFEYAINESTIAIKNAVFLAKGGNFTDDDPGLTEIGYPFGRSISGFRYFKEGGRESSVCAVYRDKRGNIYANGLPTFWDPSLGVRISKNTEPVEKGLQQKLQRIVDEAKKKYYPQLLGLTST